MSPVVVLPRAAEPLLSRFCIAFTPRTFQRVVLLFAGSVLALGRHTVTGVLWTARTLVEGSGHFTDYHRVFSLARWSLWALAKVLAAMVLELVPADEPAVCPVDDTTPQHKGKHVYGKGRHRDNCRSTRSHTVWVFGHKWVVLAVNVKFAFASRAWAVPLTNSTRRLLPPYHPTVDRLRTGVAATASRGAGSFAPFTRGRPLRPLRRGGGGA
jgi:hypothetical protein